MPGVNAPIKTDLLSFNPKPFVMHKIQIRVNPSSVQRLGQLPRYASAALTAVDYHAESAHKRALFPSDVSAEGWR
jgi:hypothetical protein